jgi:phosphoglycerate dehydrogenase-like enzyme
MTAGDGEAHPRPLAVYTDVVGVDPAPGAALLERAGFTVRVLATADPERVAAEPETVALLVGGATPVDDDLMAALPRLGIVATMSVGWDMIDVDAARARGIWVANVPAAATEEVAVHALAMGLSLLRGLPFLDRAVRGGTWDDAAEPLLRPGGATLGIIGLGRIGLRVAELGRPVYGRVVGHDPLVEPPAWPAGVERSGRDALLAAADVVSLHVPLTAATHHMIDAAALARMRRGAFLVNVSRGALVDPAALVAALDDGRLGGAALDVLEVEPPPPGDPLVRHPRTLVTPHFAYYSDDSARTYVVDQARNVVAWRRDGRPLDVVVAGA